MTPQIFLQKYCKFFAIGFFALFLMKSMQSCNRNSQLLVQKIDYLITIDSLTKQTQKDLDSIKQLRFELKIANNQTLSANEKASAIQNAVEKMKSNTTITVKGVEKN